MPARLDWPSAVGNFILNFGNLELLLFVFLEMHLGPDELEKARTLHFKDRLSRMEEILDEKQFSEDDQIAFARFVEDLEPIRILRNHIAHGYLSMIWNGGKELKVTISVPKDIDKPFAQETRHLEFDELRDGLDKLRKLTETFEEIAKVTHPME